MTDEEMTAEYIAEYGFGSDYNNITSYEANKEIEQAFLAGLKVGSQLDRVWRDYDAGEDCYEDSHEGRWIKREVGRPKWHKLDWKKYYPKLDRLVRVRTKSETEYICRTYGYQPTEDEIGYGTILTQFEQLDGDWVDDNEIEYWCYIEPFKE